MEKTLLITHLLKEIENNTSYELVKEKYNLSIYLFGSSVYKDKPKDIDILLLYPRKSKYILEIIEFKNNMKKILKKQLLISIDILLLSNEEENDLDFINNEMAINIDLLIN